MTHPRTALVLGATGGVGGAVARALSARGWRVRALARAPQPPGRDGLEWRQGDALSSGDVAAAAEGAELIVHAVNPPGYRNWGTLVLPMLDNTLAAARRSGAAILLPGTIYNYGPDAWPDLPEDAPQNPPTRKGAIRVAMEDRLRAAGERGARVLVVRAGDFFGPRAGGNWFSQGLVKPGRVPSAITYPGAPGVGHQWGYLPDVAETMVRLVERGGDGFNAYHMAGHWDPDGTAMIGAIRSAVGKPNLPVRRLPWPLLRLAAPVSPFLRELMEMRYLWREPLRMGNAKLVAAIGREPHTPLDAAVRATLGSLGCLPTRDPVAEGVPADTPS